MSEAALHQALVWTMLGLALMTFLALLYITAPYGRHQRRGWGPELPARLGWVVMESPAVLLFAWIYSLGSHRGSAAALAMLAVWQFHYVQRTFVFPFRMRNRGKRMPAVIALLALVFNCLNAYINARWISHLASYGDTWLADPRFLAGLFLFAAGWLINQRADAVLFRLRRPGESGYKIPRGGLYELVACPNYLGELVEWFGWAMLTWSTAGLAFALYTAANLVPRALSHLRWYRETFPDFPARRKALIPFLW
jgi:steroid 5-alpha-reductase/3-oxo-5-alpha-steroid 4-dehydrogenase 1